MAAVLMIRGCGEIDEAAVAIDAVADENDMSLAIVGAIAQLN